MPFLKIQPPGVMKITNSGRKPIFKVTSGDSWRISLNLYDPNDPCSPALPSTTFVKVILSETQFDDPIWSGEWYDGVTQDSKRRDLVHIVIPTSLTKTLRRGSYVFSVQVADLLKTKFVTEAEGSLLVEYKPTSEQHSIPYKDSSDATTGRGVTDDSCQHSV